MPFERHWENSLLSRASRPRKSRPALKVVAGYSRRACWSELRLMAAQKLQVPAVGAKLPVEYIADEGNDAERAIEQHIARHPQEHPVGRPHSLRPPDDIAGYDSADRVAEARYEADDAVEPEADIRSGDVEAIIHQPGEKFQVRIVASRGKGRPLIVFHWSSCPSRRQGIG